MPDSDKKSKKIITLNKRARFEYFVEDSYEAGIELSGTEVKSIRAGSVALRDCFCTITDGEIYVNNMHISPYEHGNIFNKDPMRRRRLLMHKREINKLNAYVMRDGCTLVPLSLYFSGSLVKLELGLCKGKKLYDKRADLAKRDAARELQRDVKVR